MKCPDCGAENIAGAEDCDGCSAPLSALSAPQPKNGLSQKILAGTIADLKPRKALSVRMDTPLRDAIEFMRKEKSGCALVVEGGKVRAIMTERDLLYGVAGVQDPARLKVKDLVHKDPVGLKSHHPVSYAFHHMSVGGYRHLPVEMEDGSVAIVSSRDLLQYLAD